MATDETGFDWTALLYLYKRMGENFKMAEYDVGSRPGETWAKKGGLKLVLIDNMLPLLSNNFRVKNHASYIQDFMVHSNKVNKYLKETKA